MEAQVSYISTSCGRYSGVLDCGPDGLIVFGARNALAVMSTHDNGCNSIIHTFAEHTSNICSVRWVRRATGEFDDKIITGSVDKSAIVWKRTSEKDTVFTKWSHLTGHNGVVTTVDAINGSTLYAATASTLDSSLRIWKINDEGEQNCIQVITIENGLCLTLQFYNLPTVNVLLLACAFDDNNIHLYAEKINNQYEMQFTKVHTLQGHADWVRGLDFIKFDNEKVLLASCSQDRYIRIWSINAFKVDNQCDDIQIEKNIISVSDDSRWTISLETVLCGHENWVYGVHWSYHDNHLKLLSSSLDKSLTIWEPDSQSEDSIWIEKVRVGEVGGGGLGFYGGKFFDDGNAVIGHGYSGSLHIWKYKKELEKWEPDVPCSGHFNGVVDLSWEPNGHFIISASLDQTTRIHAPWIRVDYPIMWHEIARPQVHGYDMSCLAMISQYKFASGAEEKVIRAFEAPHNFIENFHIICNIPLSELENNTSIPEGASVPSLGLSNKAIYSNETQVVDINKKSVEKQYTENRFIPTKFEAPPTEETLMQNTLWPEQHKLYGHGFEVFALAANKDGTLLASSCKASKTQYANILLWNTNSWLQIQSLESHNLTVTQLAFSPDNLCLLSVSRDRRWSIFRRESIDSDFKLDATTDKSNGIHTRVIWCCSWTHDSKFFATGSRDGKIVTWTKKDSTSSWKEFMPITPILTLQDESVTALSFASAYKNSNYILAAGLESGIIHIYELALQTSGNEWILNIKLDNNIAHHLTVKRLAFKPTSNGIKKLQLASASSDNSVKVFELIF